MAQASIIRLEVQQSIQNNTTLMIHSQQQYQQAFRQLNDELVKIGIKIVKNVPPKYLNKIQNKQNSIFKYRDINNNRIVQFPRKGAFQVFYMNILIYSKLENSAFPKLSFLCDIIKQIRCLYEKQPSLLDKLSIFKDLQYQRRKKQQQGITLYSSLILQSCGNQTVSFAFQLLLKQLQLNQRKKNHRNNYHSYSLLNYHEKKEKIRNIYTLQTFKKSKLQLKDQNKESQAINNARPWSFHKANFSCTQRQKKNQSIKNFNLTQRNKNCQINNKRNIIFQMILKEGNRNISNQKCKQALRNQNFLENQEKFSKMNIKKIMQNKNNKVKIKRNNLFFWHQKQRLQRQAQTSTQNKLQKQQRIKPLKISKVNLTEMSKHNSSNNEKEIKNKQKSYKKCSIIKRVSQNYFQNVFLFSNHQKDTSSNQYSKNKVEGQKLMTCGGISKIQNDQQTFRTFHVASFFTPKQNFKTIQRIQKQSAKGYQNQFNNQNFSDKQSCKIKYQKYVKNRLSFNKIFTINILPLGSSQKLDSYTNKQFSQMFKQNNESVPQNGEISRIIQQDSFSSSNESIDINDTKQISDQKQKDTQQVNRQRTSIEQYTVQRRISQRKRSSSHSRISQHLQRFNTLQMQIQLARKKANQFNSDDQINEHTNSSTDSSQDNNLKEWEDFAQNYQYIRQPAQIASKFSQQHHFCQHMWEFSKFSDLMCDPKNQQCQFIIKGQELTQNFIIKSIRKICEPNQIKLFPQKFRQIQFVQKENIFNNASIMLQQKNNLQTVEYQFNRKLAYVVNFLSGANPKIITRLFEDKKVVNPFGVYCIWLRNLSGRLEPIFINDDFAFVPKNKKSTKGQFQYQPIYSWLVNDNCIWFMLLEKAIAKILGSYSRLNQISLAQLMFIITITPLQQIRMKSLKNMCRVLQQKVYENNMNTLCALKQDPLKLVEGTLNQTQSGRIDRVINFEQNKSELKHSIVTVKVKQTEIQLPLTQFYLKYKQLLVINLNLNLYINQICLNPIEQQKSKYACLLRIKKYRTISYLTFNQKFTKIQIYRKVCNGSPIGSKQHIVYQNIFYQQYNQIIDQSSFQIQFYANQYIVIVEKQYKDQNQLFVFSDFPTQLIQINSNLVVKTEQLLSYAKQITNKMIKRKMSNNQISEFQCLHQSFPCTFQNRRVQKTNLPHSMKENKRKY